MQINLFFFLTITSEWLSVKTAFHALILLSSETEQNRCRSSLYLTDENITPSCPASHFLTNTFSSGLFTLSVTFHNKTSLKTVPHANHMSFNARPMNLAQYLKLDTIKESNQKISCEFVKLSNINFASLHLIALLVEISISPTIVPSAC